MSTRLGKRKRAPTGKRSVAAVAAAPAIGTLTAGKAAAPAPSARRLMLAALTGAIFLSAALMFAVQPMFTKMVLPRLGGAPQVWSVAMFFFPGVLLASYGYALLLTFALPGPASILVHLALLIAAWFTLPLLIV